MNSLFTLSTLVGQSVGQLTQGTLVANLGFGEVAFPHPVFVGDTLYGESVVESKRESASRPGQGVVVLAHTARNQDGVVVATASRTMLVWLREAGERQAATHVQAAGGARRAGERMTHPPFRFGPALLFCPADRPDRFAKAAERADAVILDLEDAVAEDAKRAARARARRIHPRSRSA